MAFKPEYVICLVCGIGELRSDPFLIRCSECDYVLSRGLFGTLHRIRGLPEVVGRGAKEGGGLKAGERRRREKR